MPSSQTSNSHKNKRHDVTADTSAQGALPGIVEPEVIESNIDAFPTAVEEVDSSDIRNASLARRNARFTPVVEPLAPSTVADLENTRTSEKVYEETNTTLVTQPLEHNQINDRIYRDIFDEMNASAIAVYQKAIQHKADYFLYGVFAGTHLPAVAWLSLAYVFALPTLLFLQNPLWLSKLRENHFAALPIAIGVMAASDTYALYCIAKSVY
jgi:hypothetical protein